MSSILKEELHKLVEALPERETLKAKKILEALVNNSDDLFLQALDRASEDDEPLSEEEKSAAEAGWQEYLKGRSRPWEEAREELARE